MKPVSIQDVIKEDFTDVDDEMLFNIEQDIDSLIHNIVFTHNEFGGDGQLKNDLSRCFQSTCGGEILKAISEVLIKKNREVSEIGGKLANYLVTIDYFDLKGNLDGTLVYPYNSMDDCIKLIKTELHDFTECGIGVTIYDTTCDKTYNYDEVLKIIDNMPKPEYINLTPHTIRLNDGTEYPPSGIVARVSSYHSDFDYNEICRVVYGEVENLPEPKENTIYIVSLVVLNACGCERDDIVAPATSHPDVVRKDGQVYSVPGFITL